MSRVKDPFEILADEITLIRRLTHHLTVDIPPPGDEPPRA